MRNLIAQLPNGVDSVGSIGGFWLALQYAAISSVMAALPHIGVGWYCPATARRLALRAISRSQDRHIDYAPLYPNYVFVAGPRDTVGLQVREAVRAFGGAIVNTLLPTSQAKFRSRLIEIEAELRANPFAGADSLPTIGQLVECTSGPFRGLSGRVAAVDEKQRRVGIGLENGVLIDQPADAVELVA